MTATYDKIGRGYDSTRKADPYLAGRMEEFLRLEKDKLYLDVGCGTGNYTAALAGKGYKFTGVDPSSEMIDNARFKNSDVNWVVGTSEELPFEDNQFDGVLVSLSIHHWKDLNAGFKEISRVLKTGGRFVLFTTLPEQTEAYWLTHYFLKMISDSIAVLPTKKQIVSALESANMKIVVEENYDVQTDLQDHFLYCGKHKPSMYFEESIRQGISSFSLLSNRVEVESGLEKLRTDIKSNNFEQIKRRYHSSLGDYLFVVSEINT